MITAEQKKTRRQYIGSSDVAAICGKDSYRTPMDVFMSKTQELEDKPTPAMEMGTRLESIVLDWFEQEMKKPLRRNVSIVAEDGIFAANLDAAVLGQKEGVEAKTANILYPNPETAKLWGDEGTDEVPDYVLLQCQEQCYVGKLQTVWVPALIGGRGWSLFRVDRNEKLIKSIVDRGREFWQSYVLPNIAPPNSIPSLEVVRSIRRVEGKRTQIPIGPVQKWLESKAAAKTAEKTLEVDEAVMLAFMGAAEAADTPLGAVTFFEQSRCGLDADKIRREWPDVADACEKTTTFRVLRHKKL